MNCVSPGGNTAFTGDHSDGDLLIVSAFTNGGSVSTIDVYRWNGGANGSLGTTPVAHGVDCKTTAGNDTACATVNGPTNGTGGTITTPWLTSNKQDGAGTQPADLGVLRGRAEPHEGQPRWQVLQHVHRGHPLLAVADRDAVRLRARRDRRVPIDDHDDSRRQRRRHDPGRRAGHSDRPGRRQDSGQGQGGHLGHGRQLVQWDRHVPPVRAVLGFVHGHVRHRRRAGRIASERHGQRDVHVRRGDRHRGRPLLLARRLLG